MLLVGQDPSHHFLYLWDKANEQGRIGHIEAGVEHSQHNGETLALTSCRHIIAHELAHQVHKRVEHTHDPYHAKHIEQQMGQSGTARLGVGTQCGQIGSCRCANVFSHHQRDAQVDGQHTRRAQQYRDGHHRCRGLHDTRDHRADGQEGQDRQITARVKRREETHHGLVVFQIQLLASTAQQHQREEHECDAKQEIALIAVPLVIDEQDAHEE